MTEDQKSFQEWLDGKMGDNLTRREFALENRANFSDLAWAFCAGYIFGRSEGSKVE